MIRRIKALSSVCALASISGCIALDAAHLIAIAADSRPTLFTKSTIQMPAGQTIVAAELSKQVPLFAKKCDYKGIWAGYERDWDKMSEDGSQIIAKAEPGKRAGYAFIVYEETCEGTPSKPVLFVGLSPFFSPREPEYVAFKGIRMLGNFYYLLAQQNDIPKWMPQAIKAIQAESTSNPAAREFLEHVKIADGLPVPPQDSAS